MSTNIRGKKAVTTKRNKTSRRGDRTEVLKTQRAARRASSSAVRVSKALDLPIQFIVRGQLVEVKGGEPQKTIKYIPQVERKITLKKGDKIWLKPKVEGS